MKPIYPILISLLIIVVLNCAKERSCENCRELPTLPPDTIRTTPNPLVINVDVSLADESKIKKVYQAVKTAKWPGHYWLYDSIPLTGSHLYNRMYDMKNYLNLNEYKINDTFYFLTEIRYRFGTIEWINQDTLIY